MANAGTSEGEPRRDPLAEWLSLAVDERNRVAATDGDPRAFLFGLGDRCEQAAAADVTRALDAAEAVETAARTLGHVSAALRARRARVTALAYCGRLAESVALADGSIAEADANDEAIESARIAVASMQPLTRLGRTDEAIARGERAATALNSLGQAALAARAELNIANVWKALGDPERAVPLLERARVSLRDEPTMLAPLENTLGAVLLQVDDFEASKAAFTASRDRYRSLAAGFAEAMVEGNLADLAAREGRLDEALAGFERSRRLFGDDRSTADHRARLAAEEAEVLEAIGAACEAIVSLEASVATLESSGQRMPALRARFALVRARLASGRMVEVARDLDAIRGEADALGERQLVRRASLLRVELALATGDLAVIAELAGPIADDSAAPRLDRIVALRHLAEESLSRGDRDGAMASIARAFADLADLDIPALESDLLLTRATCTADEPSRVADLEKAVECIDRTRGSLRSERLRAAWLGRRLRAYEELVLARIARAEAASIEQALATIERAKSRTLLDLMQRSIDARPRHAWSSDPLSDELARVRARLNALYAGWGDTTVDGERRAGSPRRTAAIAEAESRVAELTRRIAAAAGETSLHAEPLRPAAIRARLAPSERLVEYFRAGDSYLALVVSCEGVRARRLATPAASIEDEIRKALFQLRRGVRASVRGESDSLVDAARRHLERLHRMLIEPLAEELAGADRLLVVPHGPLHALPFTALHDGRGWLAERFEIAHAPSASLALAAGRRTGSAPPLVVGVADRAAPSIADEITAVTGLHRDATTLVAGDATVAAVCDAVADRRLVHVACHGRFTDSMPDASGLRLADRWLPIRELLELPLSAELVVLSACESGRSEIEPGEELVGLVRSLLAAGAHAAIVSHWPVNDRIATEFMFRLHRELAGGEVPIRALRAATLATMDRYPHPAAWAAFSLVGSRGDRPAAAPTGNFAGNLVGKRNAP